jgi:sigma-B regulation protein RsbU (phosphoserine phosphatase)
MVIFSSQDLNKKTVPIYIVLLMVLISAGITMAYIFTKNITSPIVQLTVAAKQISGGDLTVQTQVESDDEIGTLAETFNNMAVKLAESYHSLEETKETAETYLAKLRQELDTGRRIQKDFLPEEVPKLDGWEFATCFNPARAVAGDFYDIFPLPGNCVGLAIGDVCDKGVGSALFMAIFRSLLRVYSEQASLLGLTRVKIDAPNFDEQMENLACTSPLKAAALTNNYIVHNHSKANMFATLFFGVLHPIKGLLTYVNGGHTAPAIFSQIGMKKRLTPTGPAVGIMPNINFDIRQVQLDPGDILIAYTDGVIDAKDSDSNRFNEDKLLSLLEQPFSSAADLLEHIENSVLAHIADAPQFDDITMLAVRWVPESVRTGG